MKKITAIITTTLAVLLLASNLSHAAPTPEQATPTPAAEAVPAQLSPQMISQAITGLKTAAIPTKPQQMLKELKPPSTQDQSLSFTFVEPQPKLSAFLGGSMGLGRTL